MTIYEAFKFLDSLEKESDRHTIIPIYVYLDNKELYEELPSGNLQDKYSEQTLEEWYDFASTVEGIIESLCEVVNISLSKNLDSLSEYIDFYVLDAQGNRKNYLIDLRLSDHKSNQNVRRTRLRNVTKIDPNHVLTSIIVNNRTFKNYSEAIFYLRTFLAKEILNGEG